MFANTSIANLLDLLVSSTDTTLELKIKRIGVRKFGVSQKGASPSEGFPLGVDGLVRRERMNTETKCSQYPNSAWNMLRVEVGSIRIGLLPPVLKSH